MVIASAHVICPRGRRDKSSVYKVPSDAVVQLGPDGTVYRVGRDGVKSRLRPLADPSAAVEREDAARQAAGPGWIEHAGWEPEAPESVAGFAGRFTVPEPPSRDSEQVVFVFLGLQTTSHDQHELLQPVLQWGFNGVEGGPRWGIGCWYQRKHASQIEVLIASDLEMVGVGERVAARILRLPTGVWQCEAVAEKASVRSALSVAGDRKLSWSYVGLEAYAEEMTRSELPASPSVRFDGLRLTARQQDTALSPHWKGTIDAVGEGRRVEVASASEIALWY